MKKAFQAVTDLVSGFSKDAKLFNQYTGLQLKREHFDLYSKGGTTLASIDKEADKDLIDEYGIPLQHGRSSRLSLMLNHLSDKGIVFDLDDKNNATLLAKLKQSAQDFMTQNMYPKMPYAYKTHPRLVETVNNVRQKMGWQPLRTL